MHDILMHLNIKNIVHCYIILLKNNNLFIHLNIDQKPFCIITMSCPISRKFKFSVFVKKKNYFWKYCIYIKVFRNRL